MGNLEMKAYFDQMAPRWDRMEEQNEAVIAALLDNLQLQPGQSMLDVACGTGVMFPYYLTRGLSEITGLDLSDAMLQIARQKFPQPEIKLLCGDAEVFDPGEHYDRIMIYNAFPHFFHPEALIIHLCTLLKPGGMLSVSHGLSRAEINNCHTGSARHVSIGLMPAEELAQIFSKDLQVTTCIDNDRMYQVCGRLSL